MMKKILNTIIFLIGISYAYGQSYSEIGEIYPLIENQDGYCVSGFISFDADSDFDLYAKSFLWAIENISVKRHEGINNVNQVSKSFNLELTLLSPNNRDVSNKYYCDVTFRTAASKLIYHISNISVEFENIVLKKILPFENLTPQKKEAHKTAMEDFEYTISKMLNNMFDYIATYPLQEISHWDDIKIKRVVEGMNFDECTLAIGKPQTTMETANDIQWMYSSSLYVFFKDGLVNTIIK